MSTPADAEVWDYNRTMTKETDNHDASVTQHQVPGTKAADKTATADSASPSAAQPPSSGTEKVSAEAASATRKEPSKDSAKGAGSGPGGTSGSSGASQAAPGKPRAADAGTRARRGGFSPAWLLVLILALIAAALGYGVWQQSQEFDSAGRQVATRLDALERNAAAARRDAQEALAVAKTLDAKVNANDASLREARSQYLALEQAWQRFSNGADDHYLLDDVARALEIADQQLRLAGSVSNAVVALETASARLADTDRPRFQSLKMTLDNDLDRLRAVAVVDVPSIAAKLHRLQDLLAAAPLMVPDEAAPHPAQPGEAAAPLARASHEAALPADASWWSRWQAVATDWAGELTDSVGQELKGFISVQRVGNPDALRLSPEQGAYLRNGVRTRLLTAQLALMMRQPEVWKGEIGAVRSIVAEYYDGSTADAAAALRSLDELLATNVAQPLPGLDLSMAALETLRAENRNAAGQQGE